MVQCHRRPKMVLKFGTAWGGLPSPQSEEALAVTRHRQWHISGWPAVFLVPIAIPAWLLIEGVTRLFGLKRTADLNPADVAGYIDDFLKGDGAAFDWDDFVSIRITDARLEAIRLEADLVPLPVDEAGCAKLTDLLARAKALASGDAALNSPPDRRDVPAPPAGARPGQAPDPHRT